MLVIDRYTKFVLTVIAAALSVIALSSLRGGWIEEARAAERKETLDVRVVDVRPDLLLRTEVSNTEEIGKQVAAWQRRRELLDGQRDRTPKKP